MRFIEISHPIEAGMKTYPGLPEPKVDVMADHVQMVAVNLTNSKKLSKTMIAEIQDNMGWDTTTLVDQMGVDPCGRIFAEPSDQLISPYLTCIFHFPARLRRVFQLSPQHDIVPHTAGKSEAKDRCGNGD